LCDITAELSNFSTVTLHGHSECEMEEEWREGRRGVDDAEGQKD